MVEHISNLSSPFAQQETNGKGRNKHGTSLSHGIAQRLSKQNSCIIDLQQVFGETIKK
jgi:hypothetical protein